MAIIDYNNGTATISINGGQPPFSYLLLQNGTAVNYPGVNFQNPVVSSNSSVVFGNSSDTSGTYGLPSGTYTCQVTDNAGCVINTSDMVIGQTLEATTTTILPTTTSTTLLQEYLTLTVDQSPVDEGLNILFTLTSLNIPNGTLIDWDITGGITSDDISGGLGGSFTIQNNQAQYLATIESDEILEGQETFTLALAAIDSNGVSAGLSVNVIINDMNTAATTQATAATTLATAATTQATAATTLATAATTQATAATTQATAATTQATAATTQATAATTQATTTLATTTTTLATTTIAPAEYELFTAYLNRDEGQSAFFELQYNNVTPGTTVGFTLSGTATPAFEMGGMIEPMDYTEPAEMFFTTGTSGFVILEIPINEDQQTEGTETIILTLDAQDSAGNPTDSLQKTVTINDTSELQNWEIVASTHDEGTVDSPAPTFNHILKTEHVPAGTEYFWYVSVGIGYPWTPASAADFVGGVLPSGSGTIPVYNETLSMSDSIPISIVADSLTEGDEVYQIIVKEGSPSNPGALREITMMTITDSSLPTTTLPTTTTTLATTTTTLATTTQTPPQYFLAGAGQYNENNVAQPQMFELAWANGTPGVTVGFTLSGSADLGIDYDANLVEFSINSTSGQQDMSVTILSDNLTEGPETITLTLDAQDSAGNPTGSPSATVTINDTSIDPTTTTAAPEEETWYWFKGGGASSMPYTTSGPLTDANASYYTAGWATTSDLSVAMTDLIQNQGTTGAQAEVYMDINSFEFTGPITGTQCAHSWTYPEGTSTFMYVAVPDTSVFTQDLTSAQEGLQYNCNGSVYYAADRKQFTYNGASYWLYLVSLEEPSASQTYGIVGDPANIS